MPEPGRALTDGELASVGPFPIAAVGASAGGLAPTTELLQALGPDPGLGLVVIHHPTHDSALVEILARATTMPVAAAADGTKVERNHVYVVPPNAGLLISGGVLQVVPRTAEGGLHLPIDRFCESLALDRDGLSVAVVLSGSGFDGTQGVRAIKRVGGITLAQDGSASFASMPESAVRTGYVDVVAAPAGLAGELQRIGARASQLALSPALEVSGDDSTASEDVKEAWAPRPGADAAPEPELSLRQELASTRQYLESVIEQLEATNEELKAANQEVVSSNEELRSTNEELQSAKEELQATNEELRTVNDELRGRNVEASRLSDDLTNELGSAEIPMLIVGRDARLNRYTPAAGKTFGLVAADLGRPWSEVQALVGVALTLNQLLGEVREKVAAAACTIQDARGVWLELSARPYITLDGRIDGAVVVARDVDADRRAAERLEAARKYAEAVVDTVRDGLLVLDAELRVSTANSTFWLQFDLDADAARGKRLSELGRPELASPTVQQTLKQIQQGAVLENLRVERSELDGEKRVHQLNGRRIAGTDLLLLAFEDVTETEQARNATARAELVFRRVLTSAPEGVVIVDSSGQILFANPAVTALFGYEANELTGQAVELLVPAALRDAHAEERARYLEAPAPRPMGLLRALSGRRKDGTEVPIEVSLSPMAHAGGSAVVAFVTDITQRRKAEREIQAYQARLQRMGFDAALTEERERRRIAIGLHDQVGQALALAQIKLTSARASLADGARAAVDGAVQLIEEAITAQRSLVFELSPPVLYDLGLGAALAWLAEDVEKRYGVRLQINDDGGDAPLSDGAKAIVFRAVRELVMNVLKHARIPTATISLRRSPGCVEVDVQDHGVGFEPEALGRVGEGFGLLSVREQISGLGGSLQVESASQQGTRVKLRVPLGAGEPDGASAAVPAAPDARDGAA